MKVCRLKIITANIVNDTDTPKIHYVSQNKKDDIIIGNNKEEEKNLLHKIEIDINQKDNLEEMKEDKNQFETKELLNNLLENTNTNQVNIYDDNDNDNKKENERYNNIDINDLWTISNKNLNEQQKMTNLLNYIEENNLSSNYPYSIVNKKKGLNNSLRNIFKNRINRGNKSKNISSQRSLSLSKSNSKNKNNKTISKIDIKNNMNINQSKNSSKSIGLKNYKSSEIIGSKNSGNKIINGTIKNYRFKAKKHNNLKNKKNETQYHDENAVFLKDIENSWKISENDINIGHIIDYKILIDDLLKKECQLVKEKEQLMQISEQKLKPLREINRKLLDDNNEELNREDELKGELIILKNKYEILFNTLNPKNKSMLNNNNNNEVINNNLENKEFNKRQKEVEDEIRQLKEQLKNGELIFITKPANYHKLSEEDIYDISLLLKGLFFSKHILNIDIIVDKIWKFDKPFQTIYFLVEQLIKFFNLESDDRNKLINFFYSFCKNYSYMDIAQFKKLLSEKIGKINIYNKYIYMSKLLNFHKTKIKKLIKLITKKDVFRRGVINYYKFITLLYDYSIDFRSSGQNYEEILEFLVFYLKKNREISLFEKDKEFFSSGNKEEKKYSLFDLFYESLNDFINEFNCNAITNPYYLIRKYMSDNDIINAEKLLKPILTENNVLIINSVKYIDIVVLNKFLKFKGIIKKDDKIIVDLFEEELVDIDKFINDIYNNNEEKKNNIDEIKHKSNDLIDDILKLNY